MKIGRYSTRNICRFCRSKKLSLILDLGNVPLAGDFLKKSQVGHEYYYPLRIFLCEECFLVQIIDIISPDILFKDYRYISSIGLTRHFEEYADEVSKKYLKKNDFVVEIGSNDGVLLFPLQKKGMKVLGVDPAKNIAEIAAKKGVRTTVDFFNIKTAKDILKEHHKAKAIFANNVLAHIDDMDEIMKGINILLDDEGVLIFEVHYLVNLIKDLQYDFFYQEHLCYYSLTTLIRYVKEFDLEIFDAQLVPTHSGSIRISVKKKNNKKLKTSKSLKVLLDKEKNMAIDNVGTYKKFMKRILKHKNALRELLKKLKSEKKIIIGYGASGRANTLLNFCGINQNDISYVVDASPERYGRYMPQSHIPIISPEQFHEDTFDSVLILAWNYFKYIYKNEEMYFKNKDIIIPLPRIKKIGKHV